MTLSAIVSGTEYSLDDGTYCYWVGDDGLGMSPMHRLSERGPLQHGDTDRGYRLDPRTVRLILDSISDTRTAWGSKRLSILSIFKPTTDPIILKLELDAGTYYLDCHYIGQAVMPSSERIGWNQTVVIDLKANDPTFYDATGGALTFALGGGDDTMLVPTAIPMTVGASTIDASETIAYTGTVLSYPNLIRITGPIEDCVITNTTTGEKLDFSGVTIAAGHYYDIDLRYGYKTVLLDGITNKVSDLTSDSDLATWHIATTPEAVGGINSINVTGTNVTAATSVAINYPIRYIGV